MIVILYWPSRLPDKNRIREEANARNIYMVLGCSLFNNQLLFLTRCGVDSQRQQIRLQEPKTHHDERQVSYSFPV